MKARRILNFAFAVMLSGCASDTFSRRFPDSSTKEQSFVRFLLSDGNLTPWEVRRYLQQNTIRFTLKQNGWVGKDVWEIEGCGTWTSRYVGRRGKPAAIPVDIGLFYNETFHPNANEPLPLMPPNANYSMFVYYDMMTESARAYSVAFDRQKNIARVAQTMGEQPPLMSFSASASHARCIRHRNPRQSPQIRFGIARAVHPL